MVELTLGASSLSILEAMRRMAAATVFGSAVTPWWKIKGGLIRELQGRDRERDMDSEIQA